MTILPSDQSSAQKLIEIYNSIPNFQENKTPSLQKETRVFLKTSEKGIISFEKRSFFSKVRIFFTRQSAHYDFQKNAHLLKSLFEQALLDKTTTDDQLSTLAEFADYYQKMVTDYAEKYVKKYSKKEFQENDKHIIIKKLSLNWERLIAHTIYAKSETNSIDVKKCVLNHLTSFLEKNKINGYTARSFQKIQCFLQQFKEKVPLSEIKYHEALVDISNSIEEISSEEISSIESGQKEKVEKELEKIRDSVIRFTSSDVNTFFEELKALLERSVEKIEELKEGLEASCGTLRDREICEEYIKQLVEGKTGRDLEIRKGVVQLAEHIDQNNRKEFLREATATVESKTKSLSDSTKQLVDNQIEAIRKEIKVEVTLETSADKAFTQFLTLPKGDSPKHILDTFYDLEAKAFDERKNNLSQLEKICEKESGVEKLSCVKQAAVLDSQLNEIEKKVLILHDLLPRFKDASISYTIDLETLQKIRETVRSITSNDYDVMKDALEIEAKKIESMRESLNAIEKTVVDEQGKKALSNLTGILSQHQLVGLPFIEVPHEIKSIEALSHLLDDINEADTIYQARLQKIDEFAVEASGIIDRSHNIFIEFPDLIEHPLHNKIQHEVTNFLSRLKNPDELARFGEIQEDLKKLQSEYSEKVVRDILQNAQSIYTDFVEAQKTVCESLQSSLKKIDSFVDFASRAEIDFFIDVVQQEGQSLYRSLSQSKPASTSTEKILEATRLLYEAHSSFEDKLNEKTEQLVVDIAKKANEYVERFSLVAAGTRLSIDTQIKDDLLKLITLPKEHKPNIEAAAHSLIVNQLKIKELEKSRGQEKLLEEKCSSPFEAIAQFAQLCSNSIPRNSFEEQMEYIHEAIKVVAEINDRQSLLDEVYQITSQLTKFGTTIQDPSFIHDLEAQRDALLHIEASPKSPKTLLGLYTQKREELRLALEGAKKAILNHISSEELYIAKSILAQQTATALIENKMQVISRKASILADRFDEKEPLSEKLSECKEKIANLQRLDQKQQDTRSISTEISEVSQELYTVEKEIVEIEERLEAVEEKRKSELQIQSQEIAAYALLHGLQVPSEIVDGLFVECTLETLLDKEKRLQEIDQKVKEGAKIVLGIQQDIHILQNEIGSLARSIEYGAKDLYEGFSSRLEGIIDILHSPISNKHLETIRVLVDDFQKNVSKEALLKILEEKQREKEVIDNMKRGLFSQLVAVKDSADRLIPLEKELEQDLGLTQSQIEEDRKSLENLSHEFSSMQPITTEKELIHARKEIESYTERLFAITSTVQAVERKIHSALLEKDALLHNKFLEENEKSGITLPLLVQSAPIGLQGMEGAFLTHCRKKEELLNIYQLLSSTLTQLQHFQNENSLEAQQELSTAILQIFPLSFEELEKKKDELVDSLHQVTSCKDNENIRSIAIHILSEMESLEGFNSAIHKAEIERIISSKQSLPSTDYRDAIQTVEKRREELKKAIHDAQHTIALWKKEKFSQGQMVIDSQIHQQMKTSSSLIEKLEKQNRDALLVEINDQQTDSLLKELYSIELNIKNAPSLIQSLTGDNAIEGLKNEVEAIELRLRNVSINIDGLQEQIEEKEQVLRDSLQKRFEEVNMRLEKNGLEVDQNGIFPKNCLIDVLPLSKSNISQQEAKCLSREKEIEHAKETLQSLLLQVKTFSEVVKEHPFSRELLEDSQRELIALLKALDSPKELKNYTYLQKRIHEVQNECAPYVLKQKIEDDSARLQNINALKSKILEGKAEIEKRYALSELLLDKLGIAREIIAEYKNLSHELASRFLKISEPTTRKDIPTVEKKLQEAMTVFDRLSEKLREIEQLILSELLQEEKKCIQDIRKESSRLGIAKPTVLMDHLVTSSVGDGEKAFVRIQELKKVNGILRNIDAKLEKLKEHLDADDGDVVKKEAALILFKSLPRSSSNPQLIETYLDQAIRGIEMITDRRDLLREVTATLYEANSLTGFSRADLIHNLKTCADQLSAFKTIETEPKNILRDIVEQRSKVSLAITEVSSAIQEKKKDIALERQYALNSIQMNEISIDNHTRSLSALKTKLQYVEAIAESNIQQKTDDLKKLIQNAEKQVQIVLKELKELNSDKELETHIESLKERDRNLHVLERNLNNNISHLAHEMSTLESFFKNSTKDALNRLDQEAKRNGLSISIPHEYIDDEYGIEEFPQVFSLVLTTHELVELRKHEIGNMKKSLQEFIEGLHMYTSTDIIAVSIVKDALQKSAWVLAKFSEPKNLAHFSQLKDEYNELRDLYSNEAMNSRFEIYTNRIHTNRLQAEEAIAVTENIILLANEWKHEITQEQWKRVEACQSILQSLIRMQHFQPQIPDEIGDTLFESIINEQTVTFENSITTQLAAIKSLSYEVQLLIEENRKKKHDEKLSLIESIEASLRQLNSKIDLQVQNTIDSFPNQFEGHTESWREGIHIFKQYADYLEIEVQKRVAHDISLQKANKKLNRDIQEFNNWKHMVCQQDTTGTIQEYLDSVGDIENFYQRKLISSSNPSITKHFKKKVDEIKNKASAKLQEHQNLRSMLSQHQQAIHELSYQLTELEGAISLVTDLFGERKIRDQQQVISSLLHRLDKNLEEQAGSSEQTPLSQLKSKYTTQDVDIQACRLQIQSLKAALYEDIQEQRQRLKGAISELEKKARNWPVIDFSQQKDIIESFINSSLDEIGLIQESLKNALEVVQTIDQKVDSWDERLHDFKEKLTHAVSHRLAELDKKITTTDISSEQWQYVELALNRNRVVVLSIQESKKLKDKAVGESSLESFATELDELIREQGETTSRLLQKARNVFDESSILQERHQNFALQNQEILHGIATSLDRPLLQLQTRMNHALNDIVQNYTDTQKNMYNISEKEIKSIEEELSTLKNIQMSQEIYIKALSKLSLLSNLQWPPKFHSLVDMKSETVQKNAMELFEKQQIQNENQLLTIWIVNILKGIGDLSNYSIEDLSTIRSLMKEFMENPQFQELLEVDIYAPSASLENLSITRLEGDCITMKMDEAFDIMCAQSIIARLTHTEVLLFDEPMKLKSIANDIQNSCQGKNRPLNYGKELIDKIVHSLAESKGETMVVDND